MVLIILALSLPWPFKIYKDVSIPKNSGGID
jgi:hypothetical protein